MEMTPCFTTKASLCLMGNEVGELNTQGIDSWRTGVLIFLTQFFMHYSKRSKVWMLKAIASVFQFSGDECEVAIQILRRLLEENIGMCGEQMSLPCPGRASGCSRTGTMDTNRLVGSLGRNKPVGRSQNSTWQTAVQPYCEPGDCSVAIKRVSNAPGLFTSLGLQPGHLVHGQHLFVHVLSGLSLLLPDFISFGSASDMVCFVFANDCVCVRVYFRSRCGT